MRRHVTFTSNTSNSNTSAVDTLIEQVGICRDFAHVMIALCRAQHSGALHDRPRPSYAAPTRSRPTRLPCLCRGLHLGDRWYLFDPSGTTIPMGLVRFGTGRDAADVAFATIFGSVVTHAPVILDAPGRSTTPHAA